MCVCVCIDIETQFIVVCVHRQRDSVNNCVCVYSKGGRRNSLNSCVCIKREREL